MFWAVESTEFNHGDELYFNVLRTLKFVILPLVDVIVTPQDVKTNNAICNAKWYSGNAE